MRRIFTKTQYTLATMLIVSVFVSPFFLLVSATKAAPNYQVNYQGKLTNASNVAVADGTYNMRFWLLTSPSIATTSAVWTESLTGTNRVQVTNGLFSVMLGSTTPLTSVDFNQTLYLGVEIGGTGSPAWDGEMSPRKVLGAVPAAFEAENANTLDDLDSTQFVRTDATSTIDVTSASTLLTLIQSGTGDILNLFDDGIEVFTVTDGGRVGIGTSSPSHDLSVDGDFELSGGLYDNDNYSGTLGQILQSTTGGIQWVSTSTLGFFDGTYFDTSAELAAILGDETGTAGAAVFSQNPLLQGFRSNASSTIGGGTQTTGLTINGGATTTGNTYMGGTLSLGSTTPGAMLTAVGTANTDLFRFASSTGASLLRLDTRGALMFGTTTTLGFGPDVYINGGNPAISARQNGNTAIGNASLFNITASAYGNTALGYLALYGLAGSVTGNWNVAIGGGSLLQNTSGTGNTALGVSAGGTNQTGNANTYLGYGADGTGIAFSTSTAIGAGAKVGCSNCLVLGGLGGDYARVGIGTTTPSRLLTVQGGDVYFGGNITGTGTLSIAGGATTSALYTSTLGLGSDYITDLTGSGLTITNGALTALGDGVSNWTYNGSRLTPSSTVGIGIFASSTIGDGTGAGGLTINGGATTTGDTLLLGAFARGSNNAYTTDGYTFSNVGKTVFYDSATDVTDFDFAVNNSGGQSYSGLINAVMRPVADSEIARMAPFTAGVYATENQRSPYGLMMIRRIENTWDATPAPLTQGTYLPGIGFSGPTDTTDGSSFRVSASITGIVDAPVSSGVLRSSLLFSTASSTGGLEERLRITSTGTIGIGTTTPSKLLTVAGDIFTPFNISAASSTITFASSTGLTATNLYSTNISTTYASTTGLTIAGNTYLSSLSDGCLNVTSGLVASAACGGGGEASDWQLGGAGYLVPSSTVGIVVSASSTIGDGTGAGGLTISGNSTTTGNAYFAGSLGIGSTSPNARLTIAGVAGSQTPLFQTASSTGTTTFAVLASGDVEVAGNFVNAGVEWTARTAVTSSNVFSVTYGNGIFVALAGDGNIVTSQDGINWTLNTTLNNGDSFNDVTYGNGLFVVVGDGAAYTSPDGISWTRRSIGTGTWGGVAYGNGLFVAVVQSGLTKIKTSPDGITWTTRTDPASGNWTDIVYGNGRFVAVSNNATNAIYSSDGVTWTQGSGGSGMLDIAYGNGTFVAVGNLASSIYVQTSPDGITWTTRTPAENTSWYGVTYGNGLFVAVSNGGTNRVMTSPDGINWTSRRAQQSSWRSVGYGNGTFVAVGDSGAVMTSGKSLTNAFALNNIYQGGMSVLGGAFNIGTSTGTSSPFANNILNIASTTGTSVFNILRNGYVGIGSTSPSRLLTVNGDIFTPFNISAASSTITFASSTGLTATNLYATNFTTTYGSSTGFTATNLYGTNALFTYASSTYASTTALTVQGNTYLASLADGCLNITSGLVGSTACGVGGGEASDWQLGGTGYLVPTSTVGIVVSASSTIGDGTGAGGLTISGNSTTTGNVYIAGSLGLGISNPTAKLEVVGIASSTSLYVGTGTAALPSITFGGDTNTGFYNPTADSIALVSGGTLGLRTSNNTGHLFTNQIFSSFAATAQDYSNAATPINGIAGSTGQGSSVINAISLGGGGSGFPSAFAAAMYASGDGVNEDWWYGLINQRMAGTGWDNSPGALSQGDYIPGIGFAGQSGTTQGTHMELSAAIQGIIDGAVSNNVMPIGLVFRTSQTDNSALKEHMRITSTGTIGIGTTSPNAKLSIHAKAGETNPFLFSIASSTASATSTLFSVSNTGIASTTALVVSGNTTLSSLSDGCLSVTSGLVGSTACGVGGGEASDWQLGGTGYLVPTSTVGIVVSASSTIGGGTGATGLTINGGATTTGNTYMGGTLSLGSTTPSARLTIVGSGQSDIFRFASSTGSSLLTLDARGVLNFGSTTSADIFINGGTTTANPQQNGNNIVIGNQAFVHASTTAVAQNNIAIGYQALFGSSTYPMAGNNNLAIGYQTLMNSVVSQNTAIGNGALQFNTTGTFNTAVGASTLQNNVTGSYNTAIGDGAMYDHRSGDNNVAVGESAMSFNTYGSYNTALGEASLTFSSAGSQNTAVGYASLNNYTGTGTIGIGYAAGDALTGGNRNIIIGYNSNFSNASTSYALNIGNLIYGNNVDGEGATLSTGNIGIGSTSPSRKLTVNGDIYGANITGTGTLSIAGGATTSALYTTTLGLNSEYFTDLTGSGLTNSSNVLTCATSNSATFGCLTAADWTIFNDKVSSSSIDTSAELAAILGDETGTGNLVFSNAPTFTGTTAFNALTVTNTSTLGFASSTALTVSGNSYFNFASSSYASTTALTVQNNGYLMGSFGIGSTSPSARLSIRGTAGSQTPLIQTASSTGSTTFAVLASGDVEVAGNFVNAGITWASTTSASSTVSWTEIVYGNNIFVALDNSGRVMTSADGTAWTLQSSISGGIAGITYGNGLFVAVGTGGVIATSPDGVTWTNRSGATLENLTSVTYGNGRFVAVASGASGSVTSPDGITWTLQSSGPVNFWTSVTYGNGLFVAVSDGGFGLDGEVMTSQDGYSWASRTPSVAAYWTSVTYGNGLFVAVAYNGTGVNRVMTSPDGVTWTTRSAVSASQWRSVTYGNGLFVAVGASGVLMTSPDGVTWKSRTSPAASGWQSITYGNGRFVAVGSSGAVMTSGKSLTNAFALNNIYQGGMSVLGGAFNIGTSTGTSSPFANNILNIASTTGTSVFNILRNGYVGIGSTSPSRLLTVNGDIFTPFNISAASSTITFASSTGLTATNLYATNFTTTYGSSTGFTATNLYGTNALFTYASSTYASTTALTVQGNTYLASLADGCLNITSGLVGSTACGVGGGEASDWQLGGTGYLVPTSTVGIVVSASSTIGDGTQTGGLTIFGGATTTGNTYMGGTLSLGSTTPGARLTIVGSGQSDIFRFASSTGTSLLTLDTRGALMFGTSTNADIFVNGGPTSTVTQMNNGNIAIGNQAFSYASTTANAQFNIALGYQALYGSSSVPMSGDDNIGIGYQALRNNATGSANVAIGSLALTNNTFGFQNVGVGYSALTANQSGYQNAALGYGALLNNITGTNNTATGWGALATNVTGTENTAVGASALLLNTGSFNTAQGYRALMNNNSGLANTAVGWQSLLGNTSGTGNTAMGYGALSANSTGVYNTALGIIAGATNETGNSNTYLGYGADGTGIAFSTSTAIGAGAKVGCSNCLVLGGTGVSYANVGIGTTTPSRLFTVQGGEFWLGGDLTATGTGKFANLLVTGSSTIGGGTQTTGLTINGGATTTGNTFTTGSIRMANGLGNSYVTRHDSIIFARSDFPTSYTNKITNSHSATLGNTSMNFELTNAAGTGHTNVLSLFGSGDVLVSRYLALGTTTPTALLTIGTTSVSGSTVAGMKQYFGFTNSIESATSYGNETYIASVPTATSTLIGSILRLSDTSQLGNTVRGIEVQVDRGSNTKGENTGIAAFGRTFGIRGTTVGDAGNTYLPAGVFAETEGTTQGNALRAYSGTITSEALVSFFHDTSHFTGTGLKMNFGNTSGSFAATTSAKFIDLQVAGTSKFTVAANGSTTIGDGTINAGLRIPRGGICVDNDGSCVSTTTGEIRSVTSVTGNSDLAEMYFSSQSLNAGEIVALQGGLSVGRAEEETKEQVIGVVSTKPGLLLGFDDTPLIPGERAFPIGLQGRVPIKLSTENGPIKKGDRITLSSIPGVGMKATESSRVVGVALEDYDGTRAYTEGFLNQFGDDMVKDRVVAKQTVDPRTQDGCYYGAGNALGERECTPTPVVIQPVEQVIDTLRDETLRDLADDAPLALTTEEGVEVFVGQALMFIELGWYQANTDALVLSELASTTLLENGKEGETVWSRVKTLAQNFVDGVLTITGLKADRVEVKNELCVDDVCVTADDLRALLNNARSNSGPSGGSPSPTPEPTPTPDPDTSTGEGSGTGSTGGEGVVSDGGGGSTGGEATITTDTNTSTGADEEETPPPAPEQTQDPEPEPEPEPEPAPAPEPAPSGDPAA